ncbi:unnamed protein product, partial [Heterotrigona itama]
MLEERSGSARLSFSDRVRCLGGDVGRELVAGGDAAIVLIHREKGVKTIETKQEGGAERGSNAAKCSLLRNVATGVDAIPSLNCLSWSIEVHGRKQAPFYPVHSRQRERWMDGVARRRLR